MKVTSFSVILLSIVSCTAAESGRVLCSQLQGRHEELPCEDDVESPPETEAPTEAATTASSSTITTSLEVTSPSTTPVSCASKQGIYGEIEGSSVTVSFAYELEVNTSEVNIEIEIIPELEQAIVDSILPEVFPEDCNADQSKPGVNQNLAIAGISKNPMDFILEDVLCSSSVDADNTCVVVFGELTLYSNQIDTVAAEKQQVEELIKSNMDSGNFNDAQENIVRVSYVNLSPESNSGKDTNGGGGSDISPSGSIVLVGLFVAGFVITAILVAIAYKRRGKTESSEGTGTTTGDVV